MSARGTVSKLDRDVSRIMDLHDCQHKNWSARVQSAGWDTNGYVGFSTWTCDACRPMVIEAFDRNGEPYEVVPKKAVPS